MCDCEDLNAAGSRSRFRKEFLHVFTPSTRMPSKPKFLRYQESKLLIPKLFLGKTGFIYMATDQEAGKPVPEAEISPLIDKT